MQSKPAGARCPDRQVYLEIKYLGIYGLSLLIAAARIYRPASSPAMMIGKGDR
jgi:hypothetical protein